jgi:hypothetical protein
MRKVQTIMAGLVIISGFIIILNLPNLYHSNRNPPQEHNLIRDVNHNVSGEKINFRLRKFPYPYKAMLAISSDADHETLRKFNLIHQFLNTTEMTPMGKGLGLDISDSFFMYNGSDIKTYVDYDHVPITKEFTYFQGTSTKRYGGNIIDAYIHAGWMDSLHTYGDFSMEDPRQTKFSRKLAVQAIQTLKAEHDDITVWIDHGNQSNVDNFGSYGIRAFYNYQQGANPGSPYYHTDLLIPYGIQFVWADRASSVFGHNSMIYPLHLPDGRNVWGFWRYTSISETRFGIVHWVWSVDSLADELNPANLRSIIQGHQYAILAQHFCSDNTEQPLPQSAIERLRLLASEYHHGNILVTRTSRLLRYNVTEQYLRYTVTHANQKNIIHITSIDDPVLGKHVPTITELRGVTFYTFDPQRTEVEIGNTPIDRNLIQENPSDDIAPSISIKWYPPDTKNYAQTAPGVS